MEVGWVQQGFAHRPLYPQTPTHGPLDPFQPADGTRARLWAAPSVPSPPPWLSCPTTAPLQRVKAGTLPNTGDLER